MRDYLDAISHLTSQNKSDPAKALILNKEEALVGFGGTCTLVRDNASKKGCKESLKNGKLSGAGQVKMFVRERLGKRKTDLLRHKQNITRIIVDLVVTRSTSCRSGTL